MRFQCPFCRTIVAVDNEDCGSEVQCGSCSEIVTVPPDRVATGAVISDFLILEELGRGGMGVVYLAYQMSLDRQAALKILADQYANNADFVVGFIKEARAAAKLNHPHIVQAYAVGEDEGIFFFAMENVDGETMKSVLKRRKVIPIDEAVSIIQQIAEALDYAWKEQRLIHRDIKPDNIMITKNGRAKLADLGLARVASDLEDEDDEEVMGTPQYISPEHLTGAPMDVRSDIYSLGATFFHLITGRFPFEGRTATEIAKKHLDSALQSPKEVNPDVPDAVCRIIQKMMAKNVKNRYQDAASLVEDLRRARQGKSLSNVISESEKQVTQHVNKKKTGKVFKAKSGRTSKIRTGGGGQTQDGGSTGQQLTGAGTRTGPRGAKAQSGSRSGSVSASGTYSVEMAHQQQKKSPVVLIVVLALVAGFIFVAAGGALLWFFVLKPAQKPSGGKIVNKGNGKDIKKPVPKYSPFHKAILDIQAYIKNKPSDEKGILEKCDNLYSDFAANISTMASDSKEKFAFDKLNETYVKLDEDRLRKKRRQLHDAYMHKLSETEWKVKEKKEEEARKKRQIERDKRRRQEEIEAQKRRAQQEKERIEKFKQAVVNLKSSSRRQFIDHVLRKDYQAAKNVFQNAIRYPETLDPEKDKALEEDADAVSKWGLQMSNLVDSAKKMEERINDSGPLLKGISMTIKSPTGKTCAGTIEKIEGGVLHFQPFTYKKFELPLTQLPRTEYAKRIVKKVGEKAEKQEDAFRYLLANAFFDEAIKQASGEEWKSEARKTATEYIFFKLSRGTKEEQETIHKRYKKLKEYHAAKMMLEEKNAPRKGDDTGEGQGGDDGGEEDFEP